MGNKYTGFILGFVFLLFCSVANAQTITSVQDGPWNDPNTWGGTVPSSANSTSIILEHTINVPAGFTATIDQTLVDLGASLTIDAGGAVIVANGTGTDLEFYNDGLDYGFLTVNGSLTLNDLAIIIGTDSFNATFNSGGTFILLYTATEGSVPLANWDTNSTLQILGYTTFSGSVLSATPAGNWNQQFGNVVFNCNMAVNKSFDFGGNLNNVQGDLTVSGTGSASSSFRLSSTAPSVTITIGRDLNISGTTRFVGGTTGTVVVNIGRNFNYTSTNATGATFTTGANTTFNIGQDFVMNAAGGKISMASQVAGIGILNITGNFSLLAGTLSTIASGNTNTSVTFLAAPSTHSFINTGTISGPVNFAVANLAVLDLGTSAITGAGSFSLSPSSTLLVGSLDAGGAIQSGPAGNIQSTGARNYSTTANIVFNGASAQKLGNVFPSNVNLEINNAAGVTNNNVGVTNVVGNLTLTNGAFIIGSSNTLNIQSQFITTASGHIGGSLTSNLIFSGSGTLGTLSFATGTEFLNNLTITRTSDVILGSDLTVGGSSPSVIALTNGNLDFSGHTLTMNGDGISTGGGTGLKSSATSNLIFGGSTYNGGVPFSGSGNQLNNLTISTPPGIFTWNSVVTINGLLTLNGGSLSNTSGLTMGSGSTFVKGGGTFSGNSPAAVTSYNVTYTGSGATGAELPLSVTALNDVTVNSSGTITLSSAVTVNGVLTFNGGTFDAGTKAINLKGNLVSNASSVLTSSPVTFAGTTILSGSSTPVFGDITVTGSITPSSSWQVNGNFINNGVVNSGTSTITFGGNTTLSGTTNSAFNDIIVSGTLVAPVSPRTFSVAGIWTNNGTFNNNNGTVVFNGNSTIAGTSATNFKNIQITGILVGPAALNIGGDFINNGTFTAGIGTVFFNGTSVQQSITGSTVTTFNNINVSNVVGSSALTPAVQVESNQNLRGVLTLGATSFFDADGSGNSAVFTLLSSNDGNVYAGTTTQDAAVAPIPAAAGVTGDVTVQRYMSIEGPNSNRVYRYISSPVTNATVAQIQATIPVTGAFPQTSVCSGCTTNPSMYSYNETLPGNLQAGYVVFPVSSNTEILLPGHGYSIYERGNVAPISSAGSGLWSVRGPINTANTTPFVFPVTFTAQNGVSDDGWNLIGNPFPSTIDWIAPVGWSKSSDIQATIYMTDNAAGPSGNTTIVGTFNGSVGTQGASRYLATGQAFYVKSNGSGTPSLTATEDVKAAGTQPIFLREKPPVNYLRITMDQNGTKDDLIIHFREDATDNFDGNADAYKLKNSIFNFSSLSQTTKLAINSLPLLTCTRIVKLNISDALPGTYRLNFTNMESFDSDVKILFHDAKKGTEWIDVTKNNGYDFDITTDSTTRGSDRFSISFGYSDQLPVAMDVTTAGVCAGTDAKITIGSTVTNLNYYAQLNGNTITPITAGTGDALKLTINSNALKVGDNIVEVFSQSPHCSTMTYSQNVNIKTDTIYNVKSTIGATSCLSGSVTLKATGASKEGSYNWYTDEGDVTPVFTGLQFKTPDLQKTQTYYVSVVNSLGCEGARVPVVASVFNFDPATITTADESTLRSNYVHGNHWFMDGQLLSDTTATLKVTSTGTYKLVVNVGSCSTTDERTLVITGLTEHGDLNGYPNPVQGIYSLEITDERNEVTELPIINSLGSKIGVMTMTSEGIMKKGQFDFSSYSSGFYYVKVAKGSKYTVLKVIKK